MKSLQATLSVILLGLMNCSVAAWGETVDKFLASKRVNGVMVELTNESGKLTKQENRICVRFRSSKSGGSVNVQHVGIEFTLLAGRNRGSPIVPQLTRQADSQYCGAINLGSKDYSPAQYEVVVRYLDDRGKKRKAWFHLTRD
jgi:hypothetical protein